MGSRVTCACMLARMSAMARCAATPSTCDRANDVTRIHERRRANGQRQRHEQVAALVPDDIVYQILGRGRGNESRDPADEHQDEA